MQAHDVLKERQCARLLRRAHATDSRHKESARNERKHGGRVAALAGAMAATLRYAGKTVGHALAGHGAKARRDAGHFLGTLSALLAP